MPDRSVPFVSRLRASLALVCALGAGCAGGAPKRSTPAPAATPDASALSRWDALVHDYIEQAFVDSPGMAVNAGRHEFDGKVPDLTRAGIAAMVSHLKKARDAARAFAPESLDDTRRFERDYLLSVVDGELFWLERYPRFQRTPLFYADLVDPSVYLTREYAPLPQRLAAYTEHLRNVPRVLEAMQANLSTPLPRTFVEVGLSVFAGLGPYLQNDVPPIFASVDDPAKQAVLKEVTASAVAAVANAVSFLEGQKASASEAFALGPELFREMLWATERVDTPLERLLSLGNEDLAKNLQALTAACAEFARGETLEQCALAINSEKPSEGPVAAARAELTSLKAFIQAADLMSVPGAEQALVAEAPPYKRWNQAYIEIPGPFESELPSIYYIAPPDPSWSPADRLAYLPGAADLLFISVHEVWPGHFLQYLHAKHAPRMFGRIFVGYAFAEGWAHYAEELMWDAGLSHGDPKVHAGQLLNALLRDVRYVSALGLHTANMSVAESERLFREKALQDPGNAKQQAARGTFDPAYLNYTLGKLMIRKMRDDYVATRGGRKAYREFHDRFLSFGGPPLPLVRKALLGDAD
jgi:hypothetical protein